MHPQAVILFSGKRKCGKDYLTDQLRKVYCDRCEIIKISEPIKNHWAKEKNISLSELMGNGPFKEHHRREMIEWSDKMRKQDYGCFCRAACSNATNESIWIVSDVRRKTDIQWFKENYHNTVRTVRINADEDTRIQRGFKFVTGVDDVTSECDLDDYNQWDLIVDNGQEAKPLHEQLEIIVEFINKL